MAHPHEIVYWRWGWAICKRCRVLDFKNERTRAYMRRSCPWWED